MAMFIGWRGWKCLFSFLGTNTNSTFFKDQNYKLQLFILLLLDQLDSNNIPT